MRRSGQTSPGFFGWTTLAASALAALILPFGGSDGRVIAQGNDPPNRVVFLHYDYMVSTDSAFPHSHKPHQESLDLVIEVFRRHGITIVIDPEHTEIPEHRVVNWAGRPFCGYEDQVNFGDLRAQYFHPKNPQSWHYMIFVHDAVNAAESCFRVSGVAELPGYNLVVAHGFLFFRF